MIKRNSIKSIIIIGIVIMLLPFHYCNINIGYKESAQVSLNIKESKDKKVFIAEYKIVNIKIFDSSYIFPIESVWEEKSWHLILDKQGNESYKIFDTCSNKIVFSLNNKDSLLTEDNYISGKWVIWSDNKENVAGSIRGKVNINLFNIKEIKDTATFIIYKKKTINDFKNDIIKISQFTIKRN